MDDDLDQFEAELKRLHPAPPSRAVAARIESELGRGRMPRVNFQWLWSAVLPIAAAVTLLTVVPGQRPAGRPGGIKMAANPAATQPAAPGVESAFKPVAAENVLYAARDEGLVTLDDGTTARRERLNYVDTITWRNPRTNASLTWSVPREEVRVIPVNYQ
ncbi:MAG TPA: hypothetical protein VM029_18655 [Opitutaceae bacterium]|nr:hypothetical protein [Opitutaceae bacterium]